MAMFDVDPGLLAGLQEPDEQQKRKLLGGLLNMDPNSPEAQGLLGMAAQMLQASGPSRDPSASGFGQALGRGLSGMQQGRANANKEGLARQELGQRGRLIDAQVSHLGNPMPGQLPMSVQEWEYYKKLPPEEQNRYLEMKRNPNLMNLGGEYAVRAPGGGIGERYPVTPKPEQMPAFQGAQERAKATEKASVDMETDLAKKGIKAQNMNDLINEARVNLNNASGGYVGTGVSAAKGALGISDTTTQANRKLKLISGWMVSNVPRMEGPQSDFDVKNYREMSATVGDSTVPIEDRMAALDTLEQLQAKYSGGSGKTSAPSGKIRKYNPQTGRIE